MHRRRRRTWLTKHHEDQRDITALCLFMGFMVAFHYAIRVLAIFSIVTLKAPNRFTMSVENLPYETLNIVIVITCLMLLCALIHMVALSWRRYLVRLIAVSLVVSCSCLVANAVILRSILKMMAPQTIGQLDSRTVILDVDRRGRITMSDVPFSLRSLNAYLKARADKDPEAPILVCGDYRARFRDVWTVLEMSEGSGATDISLARMRGFDRYRLPAMWEEVDVPRDASTNSTSVVFVHSGGFVLNGHRTSGAEMDGAMKGHADYRYVIKILGNAPYAYVLQMLELCEAHGVTNLVWQAVR